MSIKNFLRANTFISGAIIALVTPLITLVILVPLIRLIMQLSGNNHFTDNQGILLLSIVPSILLVRYYLVKAQDLNTAKGMVAITTGLVILFFIFVHNHPFEFPF